MRVVGIDLTGSEKKPSGWALLTGNVSTTALIASDDELIEATLAARPDVVSIDSPLSVPPGTEIGEDGKVVRYERAHRESELALRRRGCTSTGACCRVCRRLRSGACVLRARCAPGDFV